MEAEASGVSGLAGRYATALFELALERKALDRAAEDLTFLKDMLEASDDLRRLVRSPVISRDDQAKAMAALLDRMDAHDLTRRLIGLLAEKRRLFALAQVIDAYAKLLAAHRGETTALVVSAKPLTAEQRQGVSATLAKVVGREVAIDAGVDPGLIAGLVIKIGSRMVDSSLKTKLAKLQLAMRAVG